jgi:hypothetical protein
MVGRITTRVVLSKAYLGDSLLVAVVATVANDGSFSSVF